MNCKVFFTIITTSILTLGAGMVVGYRIALLAHSG